MGGEDFHRVGYVTSLPTEPHVRLTLRINGQLFYKIILKSMGFNLTPNLLDTLKNKTGSMTTMSYCRIGYDSDVYLYASAGCWCIHVRYESSPPLEYDGLSYYPKALGDLREKLRGLSDAGYKIPSRVFVRIDREMLRENTNE
jgi:hypothetical protein